MQNLSTQIQSLAGNTGAVPVAKILPLVKQQDELVTECTDLLKKLYRQVGNHHGEQIMELTARIEGRRFNATEYNYDRAPDGQE